MCRSVSCYWLPYSVLDHKYWHPSWASASWLLLTTIYWKKRREMFKICFHSEWNSKANTGEASCATTSVSSSLWRKLSTSQCFFFHTITPISLYGSSSSAGTFFRLSTYVVPVASALAQKLFHVCQRIRKPATQMTLAAYQRNPPIHFRLTITRVSGN